MKNINVLLCITGSIAAYKSADLTSQLIKKGANVSVVMTKSATKLINPLTFETLSKNPVYTDTFDKHNPSSIPHIDLADQSDIVIIAPATANTIAKLSTGIADDMLSSTLLATKAPVFIAPSMNTDMYTHFTMTQNIETLKSEGYFIIEPNTGMLACGYEGKGKMEEPINIIKVINNTLKQDLPLSGVNVLITAGPTREFIDPIRFITNLSSGKMGYSIAIRARDLGANVTLISGHTSLLPPDNIELIKTESSKDMYNAVMSKYKNMDIIIKTAAVSDYTPKHYFKEKLKKQSDTLNLELVKTKDILKELGDKKTHQYLVGFAAETNNIKNNALGKLKNKNLDLIIANHALDAFNKDTNTVTIYNKDNTNIQLPSLTKTELSKKIWNIIINKYY